MDHLFADPKVRQERSSQAFMNGTFSSQERGFPNRPGIHKIHMIDILCGPADAGEKNGIQVMVYFRKLIKTSVDFDVFETLDPPPAFDTGNPFLPLKATGNFLHRKKWIRKFK
jgi:hypothetical protein